MSELDQQTKTCIRVVLSHIAQVERGGYEGAGAERTDSWTPAVSVYAGENTVKILVEIPGVDQGDVSVASRGDDAGFPASSPID